MILSISMHIVSETIMAPILLKNGGRKPNYCPFLASGETEGGFQTELLRRHPLPFHQTPAILSSESPPVNTPHERLSAYSLLSNERSSSDSENVWNLLLYQPTPTPLLW